MKKLSVSFGLCEMSCREPMPKLHLRCFKLWIIAPRERNVHFVCVYKSPWKKAHFFCQKTLRGNSKKIALHKKNISRFVHAKVKTDIDRKSVRVFTNDVEMWDLWLDFQKKLHRIIPSKTLPTFNKKNLHYQHRCQAGTKRFSVCESVMWIQWRGMLSIEDLQKS